MLIRGNAPIANLPPNQMVCVHCRRCGRDQLIITDAGCQRRLRAVSLRLEPEESIHRLLNTECADCERIQSPDAPFIIERYWQGRLVSAFERAQRVSVDRMPEPFNAWPS